MKGSKVKSIAWVVIMLVFGISDLAIAEGLVVDEEGRVKSGTLVRN